MSLDLKGLKFVLHSRSLSEEEERSPLDHDITELNSKLIGSFLDFLFVLDLVISCAAKSGLINKYESLKSGGVSDEVLFEIQNSWLAITRGYKSCYILMPFWLSLNFKANRN